MMFSKIRSATGIRGITFDLFRDVLRRSELMFDDLVHHAFPSAFLCGHCDNVRLDTVRQRVTFVEMGRCGAPQPESMKTSLMRTTSAI